MQQHGPSSLEGPASRSRGWWSAAAELSDVHLASATPDQQPRDPNAPMRLDLIERVRREIAAGTYDTPEKWEKALDRLLDNLERE